MSQPPPSVQGETAVALVALAVLLACYSLGVFLRRGMSPTTTIGLVKPRYRYGLYVAGFVAVTVTLWPVFYCLSRAIEELSTAALIGAFAPACLTGIQQGWFVPEILANVLGPHLRAPAAAGGSVELPSTTPQANS